MANIITVANQKGGVGKTTTSINLAACLAHLGHETLLIDMDPQGNASSGLGFDKKTMKPTVYDVIVGREPLAGVIRQTSLEFLDAACSNQNLIGAEIELVSELARESRLKTALVGIKNAYRFIIIDCPPSLGLLTINALAASNSVIIPLQCEYYALEGLANFLSTIERIKAAVNPALNIAGPVFTMFDSRVTLTQQVRAEVEKYFGPKTFTTTIPRNVRLAEAPSFGQPIIQYDPRSRGSDAYLDLAAELLSRNGFTEPVRPREQALKTAEVV